VQAIHGGENRFAIRGRENRFAIRGRETIRDPWTRDDSLRLVERDHLPPRSKQLLRSTRRFATAAGRARPLAAALEAAVAIDETIRYCGW
jgi:hypothetical protein